MQTIVFIIVFFIVGYVARHFIRNTDRTVRWLNNYIIYLAMPSIILLKIPALEFTSAMLIPAGFAWVWAAFGGATMLLISRTLEFPKPLEGATLVLVILGNTSFLGYPMVQAFFSDEVLSYAIFYDQLGSFLILSTLGLIIIALYAPQESGQSVSARIIAKRILSFPPFVALIIASFLPIDAALTAIAPLLKLMGSTLMPLALLVIGLQFQPQLLPEHRVPLGMTIVVKMLVAPALAYATLKTINASDVVMQATLFEAAMPCMITPGILAIQAGLSPRFCATLLGYSTLFSFVWLPFLAALLV